MVNRCDKGFSASLDSGTYSVPALLSRSNGLQELTRIKRTLLKAAVIPFAVVSSSFITGASSKALAATASSDIKAPADLILSKVRGGSNPISAVADSIAKLNERIDFINIWMQDLPHHIAVLSVKLMAWLYDLSATLILKTPLWIFNNEWFENTTYMFSLLSIGLVSVLTVIESIKQMLPNNKRKRTSPMDMKTILKRWVVVAGLTTAVPFVFQKSFQLLNWVSDLLVSAGADTMSSVAVPTKISGFDVVALAIFDVVLISSIVPVLWKNGRRFFDLMVLGVTAPVAMTAWIFDPYRHHFNQWWANLKQLSLVQIYYALFLLILGWFIFGVPTPTQFTGLIVKLLVVIGGFARMSNPPRMVQKYLDTGGGFDEVYGGAVATKNKVVRNVKDTIDIVTRPHSAVKKVGKRVLDKIKK